MVNQAGSTEGRGSKISDVLGNGTDYGNSIVIVIGTDPTGINLLAAHAQITQELLNVCTGPTLHLHELTAHLGLHTLPLLCILLDDR